MAALLAAAGCAASPLGAPVDAAPFAAYFVETTCGGWTNVTGKTPGGSFSADLVAVRASWGSGDIVSIELGDDRSRWVVATLVGWDVGDAGPALPPRATVATATASNQAEPTRGYTLTGSIDVSAATNPYDARDGGIPGQIALSLAFSGSGFDISGSVTSPYCVDFLDFTSDHRGRHP